MCLGGYQGKPGYGMGFCGVHQESAEIPALRIEMWKWPESVWDAFVDFMGIIQYYSCRDVYGNTMQD